MPLNTPNRAALTAAGIYLTLGGAWIAASDRLLAMLISDPAELTVFQTYKGWAFVAVMAVLAYVLIRRLSRQVSALRESEACLAESESRFRQMAEHVDEIFFLAAPDYSEFYYVSPAYERIWGRPVAELISRPTSWIENIHGDDRARVLDVVARGFGSGDYEAEYRIVRSDHTERWVRSRAFELPGPGGAPYRVTGIVSDITAHKRAESELIALNETLEQRVAERTAELQRANDELESFSYSVSHDLRAPLRALNGFAHLLAEDAGSQLGADARQMLERIRSNADRMGSLIDDLLAFSRIGRADMRRERVDMTALAQAIADEAHAEHPAAAIVVGALPEAHGDPAMLRQVWVNLIGNACKFSSKCAAPRIEVGAETSGDAIAYFVRDNGAGFDMAYAERLFGVFQRLHRQEDFPGTGAGLAIVKRIVTRHGGGIEAKSSPGRGATFRFTLGG